MFHRGYRHSMVALFFHHALIRPSRITWRPPACSMIKTLFIQNSSLGTIHKKHTSKVARYFEVCRPAGSLIRGYRQQQKAMGAYLLRVTFWKPINVWLMLPPHETSPPKESNHSIELWIRRGDGAATLYLISSGHVGVSGWTFFSHGFKKKSFQVIQINDASLFWTARGYLNLNKTKLM